jgi:hypothetical protein
MIAKVYQHKETKRYLIGIMNNGDVESVKQPTEAKIWEVTNCNRVANFRMYHKRHGDILQERGYEVVMVEIGNGDYR